RFPDREADRSTRPCQLALACPLPFGRERYKKHDEIFVRADARRVAFARDVLREQHSPRRELDLLAADDIDLSASADDDHVLPLRRRVTFPHEAAWPAQELSASDLDGFRVAQVRAQLRRP